MVNVSFQGRLGNQMFQYAFARLLAEELGYSLYIPAGQMQELHSLFPNTRKPVGGRVVTATDEFVVSENTLPIDGELTIKEIARRCCGHRVTVTGFFERSFFYLGVRPWLRSLYAFERGEPHKTPVVHVRGGDERLRTWGEERGYYATALSRVNGSGVAVTDDPDWDYIQSLGLPVRRGSAAEDFKFISGANEIILSRSTFAWWAAFLGNPRRVIQMEPATKFRSLARNRRAYLGVPEWEKIPIG